MLIVSSLSAFFLADTSCTRKFGGTGLGMSITHNLVTMMHGRLNVESEEQQGTRVTVELPLPQAELARESEAPSSLAVPDLTGKHVLVAEDNKINQTIVELMLEPTKVSFDIVENGQMALDAVNSKKRSYDAVLMDIHMPVMDGVTACKAIKSLYPDVPVIALTADVMTDEMQKYLQLGFDNHTAKPIDMHRLYAELADVCANR